MRMPPRIELKQVSDSITTTAKEPSIKALIALLAKYPGLFARMAVLYGTRASARNHDEMIDQFNESASMLLPSEEYSNAKSTICAAISLLKTRNPDIAWVYGLVLNCYVDHCLRMRLGAALRCDVMVWIDGTKIKPSRNNIDFGCLSATQDGEFYECKANPRRVGYRGKIGKQFRLLVNIHNALATEDVPVICCLVTYFGQHVADTVIKQYGLNGIIIPIGRDRIDSLAKKRPA